MLFFCCLCACVFAVVVAVFYFVVLLKKLCRQCRRVLYRVNVIRSKLIQVAATIRYFSTHLVIIPDTSAFQLINQTRFQSKLFVYMQK